MIFCNVWHATLDKTDAGMLLASPRPLAYVSSFMAPCPFCHVSAANGFNIVWEVRLQLSAHRPTYERHIQDTHFVAFTDRRPASEHHIQLIPKRHIGASRRTENSTNLSHCQASVKSLRKQDAELSLCSLRTQFSTELCFGNQSDP